MLDSEGAAMSYRIRRCTVRRHAHRGAEPSRQSDTNVRLEKICSSRTRVLTSNHTWARRPMKEAPGEPEASLSVLGVRLAASSAAASAPPVDSRQRHER